MVFSSLIPCSVFGLDHFHSFQFPGLYFPPACTRPTILLSFTDPWLSVGRYTVLRVFFYCRPSSFRTCLAPRSVPDSPCSYLLFCLSKNCVRHFRWKVSYLYLLSLCALVTGRDLFFDPFAGFCRSGRCALYLIFSFLSVYPVAFFPPEAMFFSIFSFYILSSRRWQPFRLPLCAYCPFWQMAGIWFFASGIPPYISIFFVLVFS